MEVRLLINSRDMYERRKKAYERVSRKQKETINFVSILRLITFAAFTAFAIYFFLIRVFFLAIGIAVIGITIFVILVIRHAALLKNKAVADAIVNVNNISIKRLNGEWKDFNDSGEEFLDNEHSFSSDLDIFGRGSLFQMVNCAYTPLGREALKTSFINPNLHRDFIINTQQGVEELSKLVGWRQRLQAEASFILSDAIKITELFEWAKAKNNFIDNIYLRICTLIMPLITAIAIIAYLFLHIIGYSLPLLCIIINLSIYKIFEKKRAEALNTIYSYKKSLTKFSRMIKLVEKRNFYSPVLKELQGKFTSSSSSASEEIGKLSKISEKISDRSNIITIIINIILLRDFHLIRLLEKWKKNNGEKVETWLRVLGEFEALSSLSIIGFDNSNFVFPCISDELILHADNAAHPLLGPKAVSNSIDISRESSIILITGSNMSGKSTFLRTLGINLILAYAGAKVSASSFTCGLMKVYSCMRISDNLEKNISSFYAEILKIKNVVSAANEGEPVFFLLDEIFKGTNSYDRHMGAEALISKLSCTNTIGLISTHDLELGELELKNSKVKNYHFQEYYKDNQIHFDYKLRKGVSTTRNAKFLMKLAGIEF